MQFKHVRVFYMPIPHGKITWINNIKIYSTKSKHSIYADWIRRTCSKRSYKQITLDSYLWLTAPMAEPVQSNASSTQAYHSTTNTVMHRTIFKMFVSICISISICIYNFTSYHMYFYKSTCYNSHILQNKRYRTSTINSIWDKHLDKFLVFKSTTQVIG